MSSIYYARHVTRTIQESYDKLMDAWRQYNRACLVAYEWAQEHGEPGGAELDAAGHAAREQYESARKAHLANLANLK